MAVNKFRFLCFIILFVFLSSYGLLCLIQSKTMLMNTECLYWCISKTRQKTTGRFVLHFMSGEILRFNTGVLVIGAVPRKHTKVTHALAASMTGGVSITATQINFW